MLQTSVQFRVTYASRLHMTFTDGLLCDHQQVMCIVLSCSICNQRQPRSIPATLNFAGPQEEKRSARAFEKLAGKIEPGMMAKHFMRPEDNVIRTTDLPEREQTYRGADPANMDYKAMSLYVYTPLSIPQNCVHSAVMIQALELS